jgi:Zn-dependent alcohol dehydrogenase
MAAICALLGCFIAAAFGAAVVAAGLAAGGAASVFGVAAGVGSAAFGAAAGASTARTAPAHADERLDMFFCRHCNEASPPGGTLEQCAM